MFVDMTDIKFMKKRPNWLITESLGSRLLLLGDLPFWVTEIYHLCDVYEVYMMMKYILPES